MYELFPYICLLCSVLFVISFSTYDLALSDYLSTTVYLSTTACPSVLQTDLLDIGLHDYDLVLAAIDWCLRH